MKSTLEELEKRIGLATGSDADLDHAIARAFGQEGEEAIPAYTSSVDRCIDLVRSALPDWHWHIGYGPLGIMPYATIAKPDAVSGSPPFYIEATAPTFPLALLRAIVKAASA